MLLINIKNIINNFKNKLFELENKKNYIIIKKIKF